MEAETKKPEVVVENAPTLSEQKLALSASYLSGYRDGMTDLLVRLAIIALLTLFFIRRMYGPEN